MNSVDLIEDFVDEHFKRFGVTRRQEVIRLLYEISTRDHCTVQDIFGNYNKNGKQFLDVKTYLIAKRYPDFMSRKEKVRFSLPKLEIDQSNSIDCSKQDQRFKNVYVEKSMIDSPVFIRAKELFQDIHVEIIDKYSQHCKGRQFSIGDYNSRMNSLYIIEEKYDFYKQCPCSSKSVFCGYHVVNLGSGCGFECSYCYLQDYVNSPGIVLPGNIDAFFMAFEDYKQDIRVGSGEMTDSLIFDHISHYSVSIVEFFKNHPKSCFEFKTKSNNIDLLLTLKPAGNIIISWSLNPSDVVRRQEHLTASLKERLIAAKQCLQAGYKVAFHFDPIIYSQNWEEQYRELINETFDYVDAEQVSFVSLGTLRMSPRLKKIIENRFPENQILNEEFAVGHDNKLRYSNQVRQEIYKKMMNWIKEKSSKLYVYLCMEDKTMCGDCQVGPVKPYRKSLNHHE